MEEEIDEPKHYIIIDNGSGYIKDGFSDDEEPRSVFPLIVGHRKLGNGIREFYIGGEGNKKGGVLKLNYSIERGEIKDCNNKEKICVHIFVENKKLLQKNIMFL